MRSSQIRADFKLIAKAYGRIGTAYQRKGDTPTAVKFFQKSLTEHRTPDILNKLRAAEREQAEQARLDYISPEKAAVAREEGNTLFKAGDFAGAVKAYTEAIKRDPSDPRGYNNRANAYTKLAALPEALKDAEEAIKVDPKFVKAYIRKSHVLYTMRDYTKAIEAVQQAADVDEEKKHAKEIQDQVIKCQQAMFSQREGESEEETLQRAMRDPEIAVRTCFGDLGMYLVNSANLHSYAEDHGRPDYAVYPPAGAVEPGGVGGPHEEPDRTPEHHKTHQCRNHQDRCSVVFLFCYLRYLHRPGGSLISRCGLLDVSWKSQSSMYLYSVYDAHVIQVFLPSLYAAMPSKPHCGVCMQHNRPDCRVPKADAQGHL